VVLVCTPALLALQFLVAEVAVEQRIMQQQVLAVLEAAVMVFLIQTGRVMVEQILAAAVAADL
jgi:hypothetical protein